MDAIREIMAEVDPSGVPTVLDKARPEDVRTDPFPHIVIDQALPAAFYDRLVAGRLDYRAVQGAGEVASNHRSAVSAFALIVPDHVDPLWKQFIAAHICPEITLRVAELFADHWPSHAPSLEQLQAARFGTYIVDSYPDVDILSEARLEVISPCTGPPYSHRLGHVDTPNRLFSALFYMRADDDRTEGGGLELFRYTGGPVSSVNTFELPARAIEHVLTVPYEANRLIVFPNSKIAIHGSEPREITEKYRSYVFISSEMENDRF